MNHIEREIEKQREYELLCRIADFIYEVAISHSEKSTMKITDHHGMPMMVKREGNFLRFTLGHFSNTIYFDASATHIGKILELVVDQFFPDSELKTRWHDEYPDIFDSKSQGS